MTDETHAQPQRMRSNWIGDVKTKWLLDPRDPDRNMRLLEDFGIDLGQRLGGEWLAKQDETINGASIPPILWSIVGPPFVGDYRRATVIHDVYCFYEGDVPWESGRRRSSHDVHRMFFHAMLADDTGWFQSCAMYVAVASFGPRWDDNGNLLSTPAMTRTDYTQISNTVFKMFWNRMPRNSEEVREELDQEFNIPQ